MPWDWFHPLGQWWKCRDCQEKEQRCVPAAILELFEGGSFPENLLHQIKLDRTFLKVTWPCSPRGKEKKEKNKKIKERKKKEFTVKC